MNNFNRILVGLLLTCLCFASTVFADLLVVTPEQVSITQEGIFILTEDNPIPVESLNIANNGYLVATTFENPDMAICPVCRHDTYTEGRYCTYCGFPL